MGPGPVPRRRHSSNHGKSAISREGELSPHLSRQNPPFLEPGALPGPPGQISQGCAQPTSFANGAWPPAVSQLDPGPSCRTATCGQADRTRVAGSLFADATGPLPLDSRSFPVIDISPLCRQGV